MTTIELTKEAIEQIQAAYRGLRFHKPVQAEFGLTNAEEYAINIFGRKKDLSAETLAEYIGKVRDGMTIGEIAIALGFPAEASLD